MPCPPHHSRPGTLSLPPPLAPKREFPGSAEQSRSTAQPLAQRAPSAEAVAGTQSSPNRLLSLTRQKAPSRGPSAGTPLQERGGRSASLPASPPAASGGIIGMKRWGWGRLKSSSAGCGGGIRRRGGVRRRGERGVSGKTRRGAGNSAPPSLAAGAGTAAEGVGGGRHEGVAEGRRDPLAKVWGNFPLVWGRGRASAPRCRCGQGAPSERLRGRRCPPRLSQRTWALPPSLPAPHR